MGKANSILYFFINGADIGKNASKILEVVNFFQFSSISADGVIRLRWTEVDWEESQDGVSWFSSCSQLGQRLSMYQPSSWRLVVDNLLSDKVLPCCHHTVGHSQIYFDIGIWCVIDWCWRHFCQDSKRWQHQCLRKEDCTGWWCYNSVKDLTSHAFV